jgi:uncharacterized protein (DUF1330 family)
MSHLTAPGASINPTEAEIAAFAAESVNDKPIVMVNLLRFNAEALYPQGDPLAGTASLSGRKAYQRYSQAVLPLLWETGGQVLWLGKARTTFIAPEGERWDEVALAWYPSRAAFVRMINSPAYRAIVGHRAAALADSRLIETQAVFLPKPLLALTRGVTRLKAWVSPALA